MMDFVTVKIIWLYKFRVVVGLKLKVERKVLNYLVCIVSVE